MLGVFSSSIISPPDELVAAGSRTPSPKITAAALTKRFLAANSSAVSVQAGEDVQLAYTHQNQSPLQPRLFAVKDEIFCLFEGSLDNLGSLKQQYGLAKSANDVVLVIEAYKALRDRAPYPPNHMVGHLVGNFSFIVFDKSTSTLFVATDYISYSVTELNNFWYCHTALAKQRGIMACQRIAAVSQCGNQIATALSHCVAVQDPFGKVPLYWGITADGHVAFADDANLLKGACGKSLASFPQGCFYSTAVGELRSYEYPKNRVTAVPATEEEIWGAKFMVEGPTVLAVTK